MSSLTDHLVFSIWYERVWHLLSTFPGVGKQ